MAQVIKQNTNEPFELGVIIKKDATADYWHNLCQRAQAKNMIAKSGFDNDGNMFFTTTKGWSYVYWTSHKRPIAIDAK